MYLVEQDDRPKVACEEAPAASPATDGVDESSVASSDDGPSDQLFPYIQLVADPWEVVPRLVICHSRITFLIWQLTALPQMATHGRR